MAPFSFGLTGKADKRKTTTNSTGTFNNTTTPLVPDWATTPVQGAADRINGLLNADPKTLVAPANGLQQQAAAGAGGLSSDTTWTDAALQASTPFASGGKAYDWVGRYMNPYLGEVVDSTAADFDANVGRVRAQQALDLAGAGAFGGSGAALTQSQTEGELSRARTSALSGLRSQGYNMALQAASGDAERATQARIANAQMALQDRAQKSGLVLNADANARANIATQSDVGGAMRDIDQSQRSADVTNAQQIVAMLGGLPLGLFAGKTEAGTSTNNQTVKEKGVSLEAKIGTPS